MKKKMLVLLILVIFGTVAFLPNTVVADDHESHPEEGTPWERSGKRCALGDPIMIRGSWNTGPVCICVYDLEWSMWKVVECDDLWRI